MLRKRGLLEGKLSKETSNGRVTELPQDEALSSMALWNLPTGEFPDKWISTTRNVCDFFSTTTKDKSDGSGFPEAIAFQFCLGNRLRCVQTWRGRKSTVNYQLRQAKPGLLPLKILLVRFTGASRNTGKWPPDYRWLDSGKNDGWIVVTIHIVFRRLQGQSFRAQYLYHALT